MNAVIVCVEYDDLLCVTLPTIRPHFERVVVVTTASDTGTQQVCREGGAECYETNAFFRNGAEFNKGAAINEGFDVLGRKGWLAVVDADIVFPSTVRKFTGSLEPGKLYVPRRRLCNHPAEYHGQLDWSGWPVVPEREYAGYCQIFHASDPVLRQSPWYSTRWRHAGGCDSDFQARWKPANRARLSFEVLHLGPLGQNWYGRHTDRIDGKATAKRMERRLAMATMREERLRTKTWRGELL